MRKLSELFYTLFPIFKPYIPPPRPHYTGLITMPYGQFRSIQKITAHYTHYIRKGPLCVPFKHAPSKAEQAEAWELLNEHLHTIEALDKYRRTPPKRPTC